MKKIFLFLMFVCSSVFAQNYGFELGNLTGWTTSGGDVTVSTALVNYSPGGGKTWTVNPYGTYMGKLYPSGAVQFDSATTSLGLNSTENSAIRQFMTNNAGGGSPTPTNASWIKKTVSLQAGTTYTFSWNYLSTDYTPFNDGSMITLVHSSNSNIIPTLNNSQQRYGLLGFTNPGSGNYSTDSYGSTGWQIARFTVPENGDYVLGFATFNLGDTVLSPMLFIDEIQGTTLLNGSTFNPVSPNPGSNVPSAEPPGPSYSSDITAEQTTTLNAAKTRRGAIPAGNRIDLNVEGSSANVTVEQVGTYNKIHGLGGAGTNAHIGGFGNSVDIRQGEPTSARNMIELYVQGNGNNLTLSQARNTTTGIIDGQESGGHIARISITGNSATYTFRQGNDGGQNSGHFLNYTIAGGGGTHTVKQSNDGEKLAFINISGNYNSETVLQSGTGNHFLDLTMSGNNNSANITQKDGGSHKATISLINAGGASSLTLVQQGNTAQIYSIQQSCATLSGCSVSVTQGTGP